jgi:hypothetical protein
MTKLIFLSLLVVACAFGQTQMGTFAEKGAFDASAALQTIPHRSSTFDPACAKVTETYVNPTSGITKVCTVVGNPGTWVVTGLAPGNNLADVNDTVASLNNLNGLTKSQTFTASGSIAANTLLTSAGTVATQGTTSLSGCGQLVSLSTVTNGNPLSVAIGTQRVQVLFDGASVVGDVAVCSVTTGGYAHDSGVSGHNFIQAGQPVIGRVVVGASGPGQLGTIQLYPYGTTGTLYLSSLTFALGAAAADSNSGNATVALTTTGTLTPGDSFVVDAHGNAIDSGAPPGAATSINTSATPTSVDGQVRYDATNKSFRSQIDGIADQTIPSVDTVNTTAQMVCAVGSDHTIQSRPVTAVSTASNAVLTITGGSYFHAPGRSVLLYGFGDAGFNGTYTVVGNPASPSTTMTISLNSNSLSFTGAGTPTVSIPCSNSSDAAPNTSPQYLTFYTAPANSFAVSGKKLRLDFVVSSFSSTTQGGNAFNIYVKAGSTAMFQSGNEGVTGGAANTSVGYFDFISLGTPGGSTPVLIAGLPPTPTNPTGNTFFPVQNIIQTVTPLATNGSLALQYGVGWFKTGAGGTLTYSSGGSATGTGYCLGTAAGTQNSGTGAVWYFPVTAGVIGSPTYANGPQANTGSGYTAAPTSWTMTVPTVNTQYGFTPASTCSGTVLTTGAGTLIAALGNAQLIVAVTPTWSGN